MPLWSKFWKLLAMRVAMLRRQRPLRCTRFGLAFFACGFGSERLRMQGSGEGLSRISFPENRVPLARSALSGQMAPSRPRFFAGMGPCELCGRGLPKWRPLQRSRVQLDADAVGPRLAAAAPGSALVVAFAGLAVVHRVAHRMLLVPLQQYTHFLALVTAAVQVAAYSVVCWLRVRQGKVTNNMQRFTVQNCHLMVAIGVCEGMFYPLVMYSAARLPGGLVQVLNQMVVPATVLFSAVLLGRRYSAMQLAGVCVVLSGVLVAGAVPRVEDLSQAIWQHTTLCAVAYVLLALGVTLKDLAFSRFQHTCDDAGRGLDVAVVSAAAAVAQFATQLVAWPVLHALSVPGVSGGNLMVEGTRALVGFGEPLAPLLAVVYWSCNIGFSFVALQLVRQASASTVVLANVIALPLSALIFCCPLPLLERQPFQWCFALSLVMVVAGNTIYGRAGLSRHSSSKV
mmetsp:Transcript_74474/g.205511  ORF Transcript_74474/g.205511 Transcript_74474/m.205511 type:complete len:455 (-) Transcript_74474:162-1526(-)